MGFDVSIHLPARMEQLCSQQTDFQKNNDSNIRTVLRKFGLHYNMAEVMEALHIDQQIF
jgi:hypothetical protein